uniref:Rho-GAP domain-containing protein n=1 Tax=Mola mola TaxID=94237 RepID=A0A3Q3XGV3_MOLML
MLLKQQERTGNMLGLFRLPGRASLVKELYDAFYVHTVASLLKLYLRQLPEPLVPYSRYKEFLRCGQKLSSDRTLVTTVQSGRLQDKYSQSQLKPCSLNFH